MRKHRNRNYARAALALVFVALIGTAFAAGAPIAAAPVSSPEATLQPAPEATPEATLAPAPVSSPEATLQPAPEPAPEPERRVDPDQKMIALTFDDGPGPGTRRILNALDAVGGRATFFMVGNRVADYAETARMVAAQGSEIATHSYAHPNLTKLSGAQLERELTRGVEAIEQVTGVSPSVLRPPYGSVNDDVRRASGELGLRVVNWNVDPEDWRVRDADEVYRRIMRDARDGAIVVCHDLYKETAAAIESAASDLAAQGYQLVTVSEMLTAKAARA